ncbi:hypothetical protein SDC9_171588 [bioreactor metagenome]|uniref:IMPACT family member YigZ n=1 Tax=bioreactor metagenome TaxID=1076179 RepID=A0A645GJT1_9ZZZZ
MECYRTISHVASDEFTIKKSRFIGHIRPVTSADEAVQFINEVKSKHWDATHNVYAYVLRDGHIMRYSDDGEPQGTAGIPVLDVLQKENLSDCAVVVTRYFGGIMLGAGGLVRAYSHGAKIAVDVGETVIMCQCFVCSIKVDYSFYGKLPNIILAFGGIIENTTFSDAVQVTFRLPQDKSEALMKEIVEQSGGRYTFEVASEVFAPV